MVSSIGDGEGMSMTLSEMDEMLSNKTALSGSVMDVESGFDNSEIP